MRIFKTSISVIEPLSKKQNKNRKRKKINKKKWWMIKTIIPEIRTMHSFKCAYIESFNQWHFPRYLLAKPTIYWTIKKVINTKESITYIQFSLNINQ